MSGKWPQPVNEKKHAVLKSVVKKVSAHVRNARFDILGFAPRTVSKFGKTSSARNSGSCSGRFAPHAETDDKTDDVASHATSRSWSCAASACRRCESSPRWVAGAADVLQVLERSSE
jgi:hypothetical protein